MFRSAVRILHIELTSRCTLACPRCPRTHAPRELSVQDIPVDVFRATVSRRRLPYLETVLLSGNYGDPIYHPRFHDLVRHLAGEGLSVVVDTNGSYRGRDWWRATVEAARGGARFKFNFSIDGLEDTNRLYRVNSRWPDIMAAVEVLRTSAARLQWKFIVFRHNEHQVEEARERAARLGFHEFNVIRSDRFGGRWAGPDGTDPLEPSAEWISQRLRTARAGANR
jgi:MoaA/NifB/PqqE/SkfB family radical SAM enzyme